MMDCFCFERLRVFNSRTAFLALVLVLTLVFATGLSSRISRDRFGIGQGWPLLIDRNFGAKRRRILKKNFKAVKRLAKHGLRETAASGSLTRRARIEAGRRIARERGAVIPFRTVAGYKLFMSEHSRIAESNSSVGQPFWQ